MCTGTNFISAFKKIFTKRNIIYTYTRRFKYSYNLKSRLLNKINGAYLYILIDQALEIVEMTVG